MSWLRFFWLCLTRPWDVLFTIWLVAAWWTFLDEADRRRRRPRVIHGAGFTMRDP